MRIKGPNESCDHKWTLVVAVFRRPAPGASTLVALSVPREEGCSGTSQPGDGTIRSLKCPLPLSTEHY